MAPAEYLSGAWRLGLAAGYAALLAVNGIYGSGAFGVPTNADISGAYPSPVTPAGFTFAIWGPIFLLQGGGTALVAYVIYVLATIVPNIWAQEFHRNHLAEDYEESLPKDMDPSLTFFRRLDAKTPSELGRKGAFRHIYDTRKERKKKLQKIADDPGILVDAAARGDVSEIRELVVDYEVPVDQPRVGGDGVTPLQAATLKNQPDAVKALLKLGADPEVADAEGNRPLHVAAVKGFAEVARRLCKGKAEKQASGQAGAAPLHLACRKGREETVGALVDAGASLDAADLKGSFPLHAAAAGGHEEIVEFLLERGADPAAKDAKGKTAKSVAAKKGYDDVARIIKRAIREKIEEEEEGDESD